MNTILLINHHYMTGKERYYAEIKVLAIGEGTLSDLFTALLSKITIIIQQDYFLI